jgi:fumarate reductase subunit D
MTDNASLQVRTNFHYFFFVKQEEKRKRIPFPWLITQTYTPIFLIFYIIIIIVIKFNPPGVFQAQDVSNPIEHLIHYEQNMEIHTQIQTYIHPSPFHKKIQLK